MIRLRTQYPSINLTLREDGVLYMNGEQVGRLFPDEYGMIADAVDDAESGVAA